MDKIEKYTKKLERLKKRIEYRLRPISRKYENRSAEYYLREIAGWHIKRNGTKGQNKKDVIKELKYCIRNKYDPKHILFVVGFASPRSLKFAKALKKKGYTITMLSYLWLPDKSGIIEQMKEYCDSCHTYEYVEELMYYAIISRTRVMHYFTEWGDCEKAVVLLGHKELFPKMVFERYDTLSGLYYSVGTITDTQKQYERYCFEHAQGVCLREGIEGFLKNDLGFSIEGRVVWMQDCIEQFADAEPMNGDDRELSLCYAGQVTEVMGVYELAEICDRNKCHFYVYPSGRPDPSGEFWKKHMALVERSEYYHLNNPVPYNELMSIIGRYDYSVVPYSRLKKIDKQKNDETEEKYKYAATNKIFDALAAGLPLVLSYNIEEAKILEGLGMAVRWFAEDFDFDFLRKNKKSMKEAVLRHRDKWLIDNKITDLTKLYDELAADA